MMKPGMTILRADLTSVNFDAASSTNTLCAALAVLTARAAASPPSPAPTTTISMDFRKVVKKSAMFKNCLKVIQQSGQSSKPATIRKTQPSLRTVLLFPRVPNADTGPFPMPKLYGWRSYYRAPYLIGRRTLRRMITRSRVKIRISSPAV